jgi:quinolinate synthase
MNKDELIFKINELRKAKNAIILAHYYQEPDIQNIADFLGDSLQLSQQAAKTNADIIVFAGVYFMAETAKILSPEKMVLIPDKEAGCSLADSIPAYLFKKFLEKYPEHVVVTYINASAEIKAMSDLICTSSNAVDIIKSIPQNKKIVFAPDKNLGNYIKKLTGRDMVIWDGACHVHEEFSLERILELKKEHPDAKLISHPECKEPILIISDFIGSTSALLNYVKKDDSKKYIVATESGIIHQMQKYCPEKIFIPAPPIDSTCGCNDCNFMKLNTLQKIYLSLKNEVIK